MIYSSHLDLPITDTLPDLPSALLSLALEDLAVIRTQPDKFNVNMHTWVARFENDKLCEVCLAGSVLVNRILPRDLSERVVDILDDAPTPDAGVPIFVIRGRADEREPLGVIRSETLSRKLLALSCMSSGYVLQALAHMGVAIPKTLKLDLPTATIWYANHPDEWFGDMHKIVATLRKHGL